ncbi:hypothetical protein [Commensalibacter papalotli (ex Servin-Garciduenas et al. 2014)]|uniref:Uncharacterized protein n=1 Tax=Commensalibacter papalotli (ex Servin-Garciduenas et al. 2014) TaxID=1208583 RepID=W7E1D6_9PROT|nr:hypothetical protein [Commensalibacter papalotli (ex Servin-Garciduenas et al. 2014)]EUK18884.1 hypothetical protein COMX_04020 [Commensalibacter papalotli (ex Servin-Garciduenas et al. 2014)]
MNLILAQHSLGQLFSLYKKTPEQDQEFIREVSWKVSLQHAALFAKPNFIKDTIYWHSEGQNTVSLQSLSKAQQQEIIEIIQLILIDIASIARLHPNDKWSRSFSLCSCFPSLDYVYVVDGRPVITGWGYAGENGFYDPLQGETVTIKKQTQRFLWLKFPWVTALVALFMGVLISLLWHVTQHSDKTCNVQYTSALEVEGALRAQDKNQELNKKRDILLQSLKNLDTQCKVPPVHTQQPQNTPELKPKSQQTIDLPKESWNKKEVSMLDGCWNLTTPLTLVSRQSKKIVPVKTWQVCFNEAGKGNQAITMMNGVSCKGPLAARFEGTKIILEQPKNCDGEFTLVKGNHTCTRINDQEASCIYKDEEQKDSHGSVGIFKR